MRSNFMFNYFLLLLIPFAAPWASSSSIESICSDQLVAFAMDRTQNDVTYDPKYVVLDYPNGDVPEHTGVCTDVVVRSYRQMGFDFQQAIHEDMKKDFAAYPQRWGLKKPDKNIDHRRVPNLMHYLQTHGHSVSGKAEPGDILCWDLGGGLLHIGLVVDREEGVYIVHNIGSGPQREAEHSGFKRIGHYRFCP